MDLVDFDGGHPHYLPKGDILKEAIRNKVIFDHFTGTNHRELASRYKLTISDIDQLIFES